MNTTAHQADKTDQMDKTTILVAVNDIFFYTKVRDVLRANGHTIERARTQQDIADKASSSCPSIVILDMNDMALNSFQALETLKADARLKAIPTLAFANHEEVDTWNRAKALGVTKIVSRNEFSARTKELVDELITLGLRDKA
jgi:PleD family two-component response regulator